GARDTIRRGPSRSRRPVHLARPLAPAAVAPPRPAPRGGRRADGRRRTYQGRSRLRHPRSMLRRTSSQRWDFPRAYFFAAPNHDQSGFEPRRTHTVSPSITRRSATMWSPGSTPSSSHNATGRVAWRFVVTFRDAMDTWIASGTLPVNQLVRR